MARYKKEQTDRIREERTNQIIKAALKVFAEYGVEGTKMSMIAKSAGLSHGLMYHYFESKEEVLFSCLQWAIEESERLVEEIESSSESPLQKIALFTRSALTAGSHDVFRIIQSSLKYPKLAAGTQTLITQTSEKFIQLFVPLVTEGQRRGEIVIEDPDQLANLYLTVLSGLIADDIDWINQHLDWSIHMLLRIVQK